MWGCAAFCRQASREARGRIGTGGSVRFLTEGEDNMDIGVIRTFFMWCTILNAGLLCLSCLVCGFAGDWVYRMHSRWFPMPRETFNVLLYAFFGAYKIAFLVFSAVPYAALMLVR